MNSPPSLICGLFCVISLGEDNNLYTSGKNSYGKLGLERNDSINPGFSLFTSNGNIQQIACGYDHTIFLDFDGNVFTMGSNTGGQLGFENIKNQTHIPQQVENLPPIGYIGCTSTSNVCLTYDKTIWTFGEGIYGELGIGNIKNQIIPIEIPDLKYVVSIECGSFHIICQLENNDYYCWGKNENGQLGIGNSSIQYTPVLCNNYPNDIISIKCGVNYTLMLTLNGYVYGCGNNSLFGQLGLINKTNINEPTLIEGLPEIRKIECGYLHSLCIDTNDNLWVFGYNIYGQLGLGDKINRKKPIKNTKLSNIMDISHGGNQTFVKTFDNKIYTFGDNTKTQLSNSTKNQTTPLQVLQDKEDVWKLTFKSKAKSARK